jgi:TonB family protein
MDVTDVLRDRMQPQAGLQRMITVSVLVHAGLGAIMVLAPGNLIGRRASEPATVMTISLGGAGEGPMNGGMTAAAARPVQTVVPAEELTRKDQVQAPAPKVPEMVLPTRPNARPSRTTPIPVAAAPEGARGRTPTRGTQKSAGEALAYTGARGQGFGLSTGGGPGSGSSLDVADFCCPDYIVTMIDRIRSTWQQNQGTSGMVLVKFTIQRDGKIVDASVERGSTSPLLNTAALRAVLQTRSLNPLPGQFPNPSLTVHLNFEYQ